MASETGTIKYSDGCLLVIKKKHLLSTSAGAKPVLSMTLIKPKNLQRAQGKECVEDKQVLEVSSDSRPEVVKPQKQTIFKRFATNMKKKFAVLKDKIMRAKRRCAAKQAQDGPKANEHPIVEVEKGQDLPEKHCTDAEFANQPADWWHFSARIDKLLAGIDYILAFIRKVSPTMRDHEKAQCHQLHWSRKGGHDGTIYDSKPY